MKRALLLCALLLVCGLPANAAISFVRVAHAQSIAASSTLSIPMTVTPGDCIVIAVDYDNGSIPPTSIADDGASGGNTYTLRTHATQNHDESIWSTAANGTVSATTITITFPTSTAIARIAVAVDYSGVQSIGGTHTATSAGSATLSDSLTTLDANNFVVTGFLQTGSDTFTASRRHAPLRSTNYFPFSSFGYVISLCRNMEESCDAWS